jgi:hypothetical protein
MSATKIAIIEDDMAISQMSGLDTKVLEEIRADEFEHVGKLQDLCEKEDK